MKVWVLMQEAESGSERDDVIAVYASEDAAKAAMAAEEAEHEFWDADETEQTEWCTCCDPAAYFRIAEWEVIE